jgi:peptidoglycan-associated lipoprotein
MEERSMRRCLAVPAVLVAAVALTACPPKWPKCENDEQCNTEGHTGVCVNGSCEECGKDADCKKEGFVCKANKCVPKPQCAKDADCPNGQKCQNGSCVQCLADTDCPKGQKCSLGSCVPGAECAADSDCASGKQCVGGQCVEKQACQLQRVNFDFNKWDIRSDAQNTLQADADCIRQRNLSVTLEGNCDERGTEEYNLHLGEKRANSAKKYLEHLGVSRNKMKTVSYGKDRPVCSQETEDCWAQNRRVDPVEK